ncbi:28S ribosomal protein S17, mitochondrial [Diabrotica virgifera virgifera]|uniref:28S ribosomal protein S17, mitochondrial n=1 Tax=Diabrotica virgifera virgifera TaxID=50390 RepID=A0A6P7G8X4_DIAVI|nr:28S ribosomal protein S17, mitochondrial [Diabrotica virgifera virgifera]
MAMLVPAINKSFMLLGQCVPCLKQGASKFKVKRLELDTNLNMFFPKHEFVYAHDPEKKCKSGDIVIVELLPERLTRLITHRVKEVLYPYGDITDPVTNKKVVAGKYRDHIEDINKVYGEKKSSFNYKNAPSRGWQEDKKDFTHLETYIKYHESGEDDPKAV